MSTNNLSHIQEHAEAEAVRRAIHASVRAQSIDPNNPADCQISYGINDRDELIVSVILLKHDMLHSKNFFLGEPQ